MWMKVDPFIRETWKRLSDPNERGMAGVVFPKLPKGSGEAASLWSSPHRWQEKGRTPLSTSSGTNSRTISRKALSSSGLINSSISFSRRQEDAQPSSQLSQTYNTQAFEAQDAPRRSSGIQRFPTSNHRWFSIYVDRYENRIN